MVQKKRERAVSLRIVAHTGFAAARTAHRARKSHDFERVSGADQLGGLGRVFSVHQQTVSRWLLVQARDLPLLMEMLLPKQADDVLELDKAGTFVGNKQDGEYWDGPNET